MIELIITLEDSFEYLTQLAQENIDKAKDAIVIYGDRKKYAHFKNKAGNYLIQAERVHQKIEEMTILNLN